MSVTSMLFLFLYSKPLIQKSHYEFELIRRQNAYVL